MAEHLKSGTTEHWLSILEPADIWCADVMDWERLLQHDGFKVLEMLQTVTMGDGFSYQTTRCPIRLDGEVLTASKGAPGLGEHTEVVKDELI